MFNVEPVFGVMAMTACVATIAIAGAGTASAGSASCSADGTGFTSCTQFAVGGMEWEVPPGVMWITVDLYGAQGGGGKGGISHTDIPGGQGGHTQATLPVAPGQKLMVRVGGQGGQGFSPEGGFNGGARSTSWAGGGGGASDIRLLNADGTAPLKNRLVVAGGGGGSGSFSNLQNPDEVFHNAGGAGGGENGSNGGSKYTSRFECFNGAGATNTADRSFNCENDFRAHGGFGYAGYGSVYSGGGGGGYYGGGGGVDHYGTGGGGGGGSGYASMYAVDTFFEQGVREGDGAITIRYYSHT